MIRKIRYVYRFGPGTDNLCETHSRLQQVLHILYRGHGHGFGPLRARLEDDRFIYSYPWTFEDFVRVRRQHYLRSTNAAAFC